jgi:hypothetical protein
VGGGEGTVKIAVLDREQIGQSLALLDDAATTDANVRIAADKLRLALRESKEGGLLSTEEAAAAPGIGSANIVQRWAKTGYLQSVQRNGRTMIPVSEVRRIQDADQVRDLRASDRRHAEIATFGGQDGLTEEELDGLRAGRPGRAPWAK